MSDLSELHDTESPDVAFRRYLDGGEIRLQICTECSTQVFPPRVLCPGCGSGPLEWALADPHATVYSSTTVRRRSERGGDYNVSIVEMAQGARMLSRVNGLPCHDVVIGLPVTALIDTIDETPVVAFAPETGPRS